MQSVTFTCPCCGRTFVLSITESGMAAQPVDAQVVQIASNLGVELGALKGGEEIGKGK